MFVKDCVTELKKHQLSKIFQKFSDGNFQAISWDISLHCVFKGDLPKAVFTWEFFTKTWVSLLLHGNLKKNNGKTEDKWSGPFPWIGWLQAEEDGKLQQGKEAHHMRVRRTATFCAPLQGHVHEWMSEARCFAAAGIFEKNVPLCWHRMFQTSVGCTETKLEDTGWQGYSTNWRIQENGHIFCHSMIMGQGKQPGCSQWQEASCC